MNPINFIRASFFLLFVSCIHASVMNEKLRTWTRADGQKAQGRLVEIVEDKISLEIRGKVFAFPLSDFSEKDRKYVRGVKQDLPIGKVEKFPLSFRDEKHRAFYEEHSMQSLIWRSEAGDAMPRLVYQPLLRDLEKLPVIIYLHGTGGMGTDNIKPFFSCGGGAAKHLLAESFQKRNPCIVITPQIQRHSGWYCSHYKDPSREQIWLKNAIRVMAQEVKYAIDLDRIYIMGHSMGGHGVYEAMAKLPDFYAAGVAIAAVDDGASLTKDNVNGNLWIFLNRNDKAEELSVAEDFKRKYRKMGGKIKLTVYDSGGHNAWDRTLQDHDFRSLLFKQKRK
jgi:predicted peptidase